MTQAQATNREPTMEEILSSIRRIIEDNNAPKGLESAMSYETNVGDSVIDHHEPVDSNVASFEREFAAADVFSKPVQNSIAAQEHAKQDYGKSNSTATASMRTDPVVDLPITHEHSTVQAAPVIELEQVRPSPFHELRPIISETASRQVAKSFEDLSVALHEERNTSVAQMTEEMVRPMLQDWLDNNLPTLVERLVREEIERVSRGVR